MNLSNEWRQEAILEAVLNPTEPWLPELTELLVDSGWQELDQDFGISPETYSTANVIHRNPASPSEGVSVSIPTAGGKYSSSIEFLTDDVQAHFCSKDYRFLVSCEKIQSSLVEALSRALDLIALVPSLYISSTQLVRRVHPLESGIEDCDISFSDPKLPFSIFVSVPKLDSPNASLRLAEAVVHESMHLQLTLLEKISPLALSPMPTHYSPWKQANRDASGVLHALYVFTVVDAWLQRLPKFAIKYSGRRRAEIAKQVSEISQFSSAELSEVGDAIRRYLFSQY